MRKVFLPALTALLLNASLVAQITTTPPAQVNVPRVTTPSTLLGRQFTADSLRAKNFTAAQTLNVFKRVENSDSFQVDLSNDLITMYQAGYNSRELIEAAKTQYPRMSIQVAYKVFYSALERNRRRGKNQYWPWHLKDTINTVYNNNTAYVQKSLRDAGADCFTIFQYYYGPVYYAGNPGAPYNGDRHLSLYINAGFTPVEIADLITSYFTNTSDRWLNNYTKGMKLANVSARDIALALKTYKVEATKITVLLNAAGYPPAEVLAALQGI